MPDAWQAIFGVSGGSSPRAPNACFAMAYYNDPDNPFRRMDYEQLHAACWSVRGQLTVKGVKTPQQRRQLAVDCEMLIQVLSSYLFNEGPGHPAYMIRWHDQTIDQAFMDHYSERRERLRADILRRAALAVLGGPGGDDWISHYLLGLRSKQLLGGDSDAGLLKGLAELEALRPRPKS